MSASERLELYKTLIPLFMGQLTILIVQVIHAWASRQGRVENREQNREILQQVSETKGKLE